MNDEQTLIDTMERYIAGQGKANDMGDWAWLADEFYTPDAEYICEYAGTMLVHAKGREDIRQTHYGRDMQRGWEGWSFPYEAFTVRGNQIITRWYNRGPGKRADGSYFQTPGVSFITYAGDGKFSHQFDMFDLAHQLRLCDELEEANLLSPQLKTDWVIPMKQKLIEMLSQNLR